MMNKYCFFIFLILVSFSAKGNNADEVKVIENQSETLTFNQNISSVMSFNDQVLSVRVENNRLFITAKLQGYSYIQLLMEDNTVKNIGVQIDRDFSNYIFNDFADSNSYSINTNYFYNSSDEKWRNDQRILLNHNSGNLRNRFSYANSIESDESFDIDTTYNRWFFNYFLDQDEFKNIENNGYRIGRRFDNGFFSYKKNLETEQDLAELSYGRGVSLGDHFVSGNMYLDSDNNYLVGTNTSYSNGGFAFNQNFRARESQDNFSKIYTNNLKYSFNNFEFSNNYFYSSFSDESINSYRLTYNKSNKIKDHKVSFGAFYSGADNQASDVYGTSISDSFYIGKKYANSIALNYLSSTSGNENMIASYRGNYSFDENSNFLNNHNFSLMPEEDWLSSSIGYLYRKRNFNFRSTYQINRNRGYLFRNFASYRKDNFTFSYENQEEESQLQRAVGVNYAYNYNTRLFLEYRKFDFDDPEFEDTHSIFVGLSLVGSVSRDSIDNLLKREYDFELAFFIDKNMNGIKDSDEVIYLDKDIKVRMSSSGKNKTDYENGYFYFDDIREDKSLTYSIENNSDYIIYNDYGSVNMSGGNKTVFVPLLRKSKVKIESNRDVELILSCDRYSKKFSGEYVEIPTLAFPCLVSVHEKYVEEYEVNYINNRIETKESIVQIELIKKKDPEVLIFIDKDKNDEWDDSEEINVEKIKNIGYKKIIEMKKGDNLENIKEYKKYKLYKIEEDGDFLNIIYR